MYGQMQTMPEMVNVWPDFNHQIWQPRLPSENQRILKEQKGFRKKRRLLIRQKRENGVRVEKHHVWTKRWRNRSGIHDRTEIKNVYGDEHDAWHNFLDNRHPRTAFIRAVNLCFGKTSPTQKEKRNLWIMTGFDWKDRPLEAILCIFDKFMPSELANILIPYCDQNNRGSYIS